MALIATPARRRLAMIALLLLALAGSFIRYLAPDPSTLRDIGTLLMVLWLPAVGNLVAYFVRKIPRRAPHLTAGFGAGSAFMPHLRVRLEPARTVRDLTAALASAGNSCTLVVANSGFTARLGGPAPSQGEQGVEVELLRPEVALAQLTPGTEFRLAVGATAVAKGRVVEVVGGR
jgi:peptidoglycan/LPS O-acetylase OafA/YrhL